MEKLREEATKKKHKQALVDELCKETDELTEAMKDFTGSTRQKAKCR
jgi:hypothetical protein